MAVRGDAARLALVEAAERLFAERGIEGVSLRDVSAAAGQRNHNAAQYHFGDRLGLVAAVYENRMRIVNARRHEYLAGVDDDDVRGLVAAVVVPLVEVVAEIDGWYARFQARARWDTEAWDALQRVPSGDSFTTAMKKLSRTLSDLPSAVRRSRLDQLMTLVLGTIAGWEAGQSRLSAEALENELISTGVAVLTAPVLQGANA